MPATMSVSARYRREAMLKRFENRATAQSTSAAGHSMLQPASVCHDSKPTSETESMKAKLNRNAVSSGPARNKNEGRSPRSSRLGRIGCFSRA